MSVFPLVLLFHLVKYVGTLLRDGIEIQLTIGD